MNYEKIFMGSVSLHVITTDKFKTNTMETIFRSKLDNNITIRNLLKTVLMDSNMKYKTERDFVKETENLYDLKIVSSFSRIGNDTTISFKTRFLDEKYTEEGMNAESISFYLDTIFNPLVVDSSFNKDVVNKCKKKIEKSIISLTDNKLKYALLNLFQTAKDMPYSNSSYGKIEELNNIDEHKLYEYYKKMLKEDTVDILFIGNIDASTLKEMLKDKLKISTYKKEKNDILVKELPLTKRVKTSSLEDNTNQTQLTMLYALHNLTDFERKYVIRVYNEILGGSACSMLFDDVREKNSLCYYINADVKPYDNILFIYSGISYKNKDKVVKLIKKTLSNIEKGKISDDVFTSAKETITSSIIASMDNPSGILNTYYAKDLVGSALFEERIEAFNKVTKEDVVKVSKKLKLYSIFTLGKESNNEKD